MTKNDFRDLQLFMLSDRLTYETMDRYVHRQEDFEARVAARLDASWTLGRKGSWINALPAGARLPLQGWKIHLSARLADADGVLDAVLGVLVPRRVPFKFLLDRDVLRMTNSKSWSRGGSGKFVTVYPKDEAEFRALLEALHAATERFQGPYILSDRRYAKSRVVFYRFGGITPNMSLGAGGRKTPLLATPSGASMPDVRTPFFELPSWMADLFPEPPEEGGDLLDGRYAVESSLGFSSSGGVYLAKDTVSGRKVVLKEARPWVNETEDGRDIVALLEGEHAILVRLEGTAVAPAALGLFREWEHTFLAQEYLEGAVPLAKWSARHDLILRTRFSADEARTFLGDYARIFANLAAALKALHERGVLFGDFSANNVMLDPETLAVRLIDFEGSRLAGDSSPARFFTPGFSDPRRAQGPLTPADDYYAFGANMLYALARVGPLEALKPGIAGGWLEHLAARFPLPPALTEAVAALTHPDPGARPAPWELMPALLDAAAAMPRGGERRTLPEETAAAEDYSDLLDSVTAHLGAAADLARKDRLWPASPDVFQTNPYNLAYGACGVLDVLRRVAPERAVPALWDWVRRAELSPRDVPPGLHVGFAGVAWALLDAGYAPEAAAAFRAAVAHPDLHAAPGLYEGTAGVGLTALRFWLAGDAAALDAARAAGERLLATAHQDAAGLSWPSEGSTPVGLGHGAAGIAVFLAALGRACADARFSEAAGRALDFDVAQGVATQDGGLSFPARVGAESVLLPYLETGSAGIGAACLRVARLTGEGRWDAALEGILVDCDRVYSAFPGRSSGLAGLGEFLLDGLRLTGDRRYRRGALRVAAGLRRFAVPVPGGTAFPGEGLMRLSCDFAAGSAGVASFLHRLKTGAAAPFMLDELLEDAR